MVERLWACYSPDGAPINLEAISGICSTGPNSVNLLAGLEAMDANGDGEVEHAEMLGYFKVVGANMTDDEMQLVIDELIGGANASSNLKGAL